MTDPTPLLYSTLAPWWPLLSAPEDYEEEAGFYADALAAACDAPPRDVLELGSGGGNNASWMKARFRLTLVEPSAGMRAHSERLNPECEHVDGDMRSVRLGRTFDAVFVHDAVEYMTTEDDLRRAVATAFVHCRPGGAALFAPDHVRETLAPETSHGGHDAPDGRGLRYVQWVWDPDPSDTTCRVDYAYLLREADGGVRVEHDRHVCGVFGRDTWTGLLAEAGFEPERVPFAHSGVARELEVFVGRRPAG